MEEVEDDGLHGDEGPADQSEDRSKVTMVTEEKEKPPVMIEEGDKVDPPTVTGNHQLFPDISPQDEEFIKPDSESEVFLEKDKSRKVEKRTRGLSKSDLEMSVGDNEFLLDSTTYFAEPGIECDSLLDRGITEAAAMSCANAESLSSQDVSLPEEELVFQASFLSSSLPAKFPSYLIPSDETKESLSARGYEGQSGTSGVSPLQQPPAKSKSKHFLNFTLPPTQAPPTHVRHSSVSSKSSLNFHYQDDVDSREERSSVSDSESRKPRRQFLKLTHSLSATKLPSTSTNTLNPPEPPKFTPPVQVTVIHKESVDGRHALNYGPESALDDMLSDIRMLSQESDSEAEVDVDASPGVAIRPIVRLTSSPGGIRHRGRRVKPPRKGDKKTGRRRKKKKHDLDELDDDDPASSCVRDIPPVLTCPVCLDVFFNAYVLQPCSHIFCEPCLRRLAKYSQDAMRITTCPVCRNPIDTCVKDTALTGQVEFYCPEDFRRRYRLERNNKYMRHPLPSSAPTSFSPKHQLSRIVSRLDRNRLARRRARVGTTPIRLDIWRFLSLAIGFVLFKVLILTVMLCLYCMLYDQSLHQKLMEFSISGVLEVFRYVAMATPKLWGFAGLFTFGGVLVFVLKFTHSHGAWNYKPFPEHQRVPLS